MWLAGGGRCDAAMLKYVLIPDRFLVHGNVEIHVAFPGISANRYPTGREKTQKKAKNSPSVVWSARD